MKRSTKKTQEIIHILPQYDPEASIEGHYEFFMKNWELAATLDYVPATLEELKRIDFMDCKVVMGQNPRFYDAAIALSGDIIAHMIDVAKKLVAEGEIECEPLDDVQTLEDLLHTSYFGDDYESSRDEFVSTFVDVYLYS